jgi:phosphohistidine phosphatase SixA
MKKILITITAFTLTLLSGFAQEKQDSEQKTKLIKELQKGGLVIYFRHASTEKEYAYQLNAHGNDGSTQRVLSEKGWHEAVHIGNAFKFHKIPVGEVLSSEYFRAWQTAWLAFGKYKKEAKLNFLPFEEYTAAQTATMKKTLAPFLSSKLVDTTTNFIIVGHDDLFEAATGIYPEPQGIAHIIKPLGGGKFEVLGSIKPEAW